MDRTALCFALALAISGCAGAKTEQPVVTTGADGRTTSPSGTDAAKRGRSLVRFVNAAPQGPALDLSTDERTTFLEVEFKTVTPYTEIPDNLVKFRIRGPATDSIFAETTEALGDGLRYTVIAMPTADQGVRLRVFRDEIVPDSGKSRIRVINAAPGLDDADVRLTGLKDPLFENIAFGSEAGFTDVDPATATLDIRASDNPTPPVRIRNFRLGAGRAYTIIIATAPPRGVQTISFNDAVRP